MTHAKARNDTKNSINTGRGAAKKGADYLSALEIRLIFAALSAFSSGVRFA